MSYGCHGEPDRTVEKNGSVHTCTKWELPAMMSTGRCNLGGSRHSSTHNKAPELVRGIREAVPVGLRSKMRRNGPGHAVVMALMVAVVGYGARKHSRQSEKTLRSLHQRRECAAFRKGEQGCPSQPGSGSSLILMRCPELWPGNPCSDHVLAPFQRQPPFAETKRAAGLSS